MKTHKQYGMTLIELMTALAIGAFLMLGAITVFVQSRTTFRISESLARMQENARFALAVIEPDVRMAHYWGLTTSTASITNRAAPTAGNGLGPDDCGNNWTINLDQAIQAGNNGYTWACPSGQPAQANADTLIVRRASESPVVPAMGGLHLQSQRGTGDSEIFDDTTVPGGFSPTTSQTHRLIANGYYVTSGSTVGANVPALRRQTLQPDGTMLVGGEELVAGIEDLQIQFGVDTDTPGTIDRGGIDRYVDPDDPMIDPTDAAFDPNAEILAVRVWVRVRAERPENGFTDTATYTYADQNVGPFNDGFRRLVVSKTIYVRNARPLS